MAQCDGGSGNEFLTRFYSSVLSCDCDLSVVSECGDVMVLLVSCNVGSISVEVNIAGSMLNCKFSGCIGVRDRLNFRNEIVRAVKAEDSIDFLPL